MWAESIVWEALLINDRGATLIESSDQVFHSVSVIACGVVLVGGSDVWHHHLIVPPNQASQSVLVLERGVVAVVW